MNTFVSTIRSLKVSNLVFFAALLLLTHGTLAQLQLSLDGIEQQKQRLPEQNPVTAHVQQHSSAQPGDLALQLQLRMPSTVHVYAAESLFFAITFDSLVGVDTPIVAFPAVEWYRNFDGSEVEVFDTSAQFGISARLSDSAWYLRGAIRFQACTKTMCYPPRTFTFVAGPDGAQLIQTPGAHLTQERFWQQQLKEFRVAGSLAGYQDVAAFGDFLKNPSTAGTAVFDGKGILLILLLVLVGGVALNLTPCVLPMLPITIAIIGAGVRAGSRKRGFAMGGVYGLGMAVAYGALGVAVSVSGARFGAINASPMFNLGIAVLFIVLALAMFDLLHIDFSRFRSPGATPGKGTGVAGVFAMGVVAALLAGACVAPVVISTVVYAASLYSQGNLAGLLIPFVLGAGMALPWPFAGAGLSFLPKPGGWMVWVRSAFGVFILIMALMYGYTGVKLLAPPAEHASASDGPQWIHSLEEGLELGRRQNKPVLIDFWATWCKNCVVMDATTFRDPSLVPLFNDYIMVKYQAERPDESPAAEVLTHFGVVGLPTYVVLQPLEGGN